jgi:hypothetical protein
MLKKTGTYLHHYLGWLKTISIICSIIVAILTAISVSSKLIKSHDRDVIIANNRNIKQEELITTVNALKNAFINFKNEHPKIEAIQSYQLINHFDSVRLHDLHFIVLKIDSISELNKSSVREILKDISDKNDTLKKNELTTGLLK